jgi:hypothetical protein
MRNDAVVQGLSEMPNMQDIRHWGVFTIGTGLGNAPFMNKKSEKLAQVSAPCAAALASDASDWHVTSWRGACGDM